MRAFPADFGKACREVGLAEMDGMKEILGAWKESESNSHGDGEEEGEDDA